MTEAERAELYRQELCAQQAFRYHNVNVTLGGNRTALQVLWDAWRPVLDQTNYIPGIDEIGWPGLPPA